MPNPKYNFSKSFIFLKGSLIRFDDRPYLPQIYSCCHRNLVLRCSRQVEKSTLLCNTIAYEAVVNPGISILFVSPRQEQGRIFVQDRLLPALRQSPIVRRALFGKSFGRIPVTYMRFANGSSLKVSAAYRSADAVRGISADLLLIDEFQDLAAGDLPVLAETLSHSASGRMILTGTPKLNDNHLEALFTQSTANEWTVACSSCKKGVILDEQCLGPTSVICPKCRVPLDVTTGQWVARNPTATWGDGYWINHLMAPWINYDQVLDRQRTYDRARFKNETLGLPVSLGEHIVTREELEQCCTDRPMAGSLDEVPLRYRSRLIAGIDWGGGSRSRTAVTIGFMRDDFVFEICHLARYRAEEDPNLILDLVVKLCRKFQIQILAADGAGHGHVYNGLLIERLKLSSGMYAILYSGTGQAPYADGDLMKWTVDRSANIGALFARVKARKLLFPRSLECGSFLDEFACEVAEYDDINRMIKYTHPATIQDDALHATVYALLIGVRGFNVMSSYE